MALLTSILKGIHTMFSLAKKGVKLKNKGHIGKAIRDTLITYAMLSLFIVSVIAGAIYSVTGAIGEIFNTLLGKADSSGQSIEQIIDSMSDEELENLVDQMGGYIDLRKVKDYIREEGSSVPSSITGNRITILNGGSPSTQQVTIDTTSYINKYKTRWEFLAALDLATFKSGESDDKTVITNAVGVRSEFDWNKEYSRDTIDYWKEWTETVEYDPTTNKSTTVENTKNKAKENSKEVREPLAIPNTVKTMFGDIKYNVTKDKVIKNENWSAPFVIEEVVSTREEFWKMVDDYTKPKYKTEEIYILRGTDSDTEYIALKQPNSTFKADKDIIYSYIGTDDEYYVYQDTKNKRRKLLLLKSDVPFGQHRQNMVFKRKDTRQVHTGEYEQKELKKTITITKRTMKSTKQKIVEDVVSSINENFNPTKFIKYINDCGMSVTDLDLIRETLINVPNGTTLVQNIDKVIEGGYTDIANGGSTNVGGGNGGSMVGVLPLYLQWDKRWGHIPYSGDTIGLAGCGPTTMAMIITGLSGNVTGIDTNGDSIVDPIEACAWSEANGYAAYKQGSYNTLISAMSSQAGLECVETYDGNAVYEALKQGKVAVANVGPGTIINGHHFLALTGVNADGKVMMNDPNSIPNSEKGWDMKVIQSETKTFWIIDNPNLSKTQRFTMKVRNGAMEGYRAYGVLPSITMAQAALESGWGESKLAIIANNLFGIKADPSWTGPYVEMQTGENYNDVIVARFRAYDSWSHSVQNQGQFLKENSRYTQYGLFNATDYKGQAQALEDAGYATTTDQFGNKIYAEKLIEMVECFRFDKYDELVKNEQ